MAIFTNSATLLQVLCVAYLEVVIRRLVCNRWWKLCGPVKGHDRAIAGVRRERGRTWNASLRYWNLLSCFMKDEYLDGVKVFDYYVRAKERLVLEPISRVKFDDIRNRLYWLPAVFVEIKIDKHCCFITSRNSVDVMNRRRPTEWKCPRICHCLSLATFGYLGPSGRWFNIVFTLLQRLCGISGILFTLAW
jgi:hypothetical protein